MIYKFGCFKCGEESDQEISTNASHVVCPFCKTHNSTVALLVDDIENLKGKIKDEYLKNTRLSNRFYDMEEQIKLLKEALLKISNYGEGTHRDRHMSSYDCMEELQVEFQERADCAREALKKLEEMENSNG
jgi:hypothetical protein